MKKITPHEACVLFQDDPAFPTFGRNVMSDKAFWLKVTDRKLEVAKSILIPQGAALAQMGYEIEWEPKVEENAPLYMNLLPDERVAVYFPKPLTELNNRVKGIQGAKWNRNHWEFILNLEACEELPKLREEYGFDIPQNIYDAIERSKSAGLAAALDSRAASAVIPDWLANRLNGSPYPFQNVGMVFGLRHKRCFINDDQGLGKTVEAIGVLEGAEAFKALLVVPNSVKLNWAAEVLAWLPHRSVSIYMTGRKKPINVYVRGKKVSVPVNSPYADVVIVNYDSVDKHKNAFMCFQWKAMVLDESHYIANPKAKRTKAILEVVNHVKPEYRLALTGTPVANKPHELITQLEFLDRMEEFGSRTRFMNRFCNFALTGYGGVKFNEPDIQRLYELNGKLRPFQVRRLKGEVLKELPPKQRTTLPVEIDNRSEYDWALKDLIAWLKDYVAKQKRFLQSISHLPSQDQQKAIKVRQANAEERALRGMAFRKIQALRLIAVKGKIPAMKLWIKDFLRSGNKLVVYCIHREIQEELFEAFPGAARIYGGDSLTVRKANEKRFQEDNECKLIICSIPAAAEGITLTAASDMVIVEMPWTALKCNQTEDRIHRIGQEEQCIIYYILATETIDEDIGMLIDGKRKMMSAVTDGELDEELEEAGIMDSLISKLTD